MPDLDKFKAANCVKTEMRQRLAREPFEEKIRKAAQLIRLAKNFPRAAMRQNDSKRETEKTAG